MYVAMARASHARSRRFLVGLALCVSGGHVPTASADAESLRQRHAAILFKALSYDDKLVERGGPEMVVAVVYRAGGTDAAEAEAWYQAFFALRSWRFLGLPFRPIKLPLHNAERLRKTIVQEGIDALFVMGLGKDDLIAVEKAARESKVVTMASQEEQIAAGLSLGVFVIDGKNTLLVNLAASREEGAVFNSAMLKLAKVIK
jgi:hypothetical protein